MLYLFVMLKSKFDIETMIRLLEHDFHEARHKVYDLISQPEFNAFEGDASLEEKRARTHELFRRIANAGLVKYADVVAPVTRGRFTAILESFACADLR